MNLTIPIRADKLSYTVYVKNHLYHLKTDFQTIDIYESELLGKILTLDGHIQLTTFDEAHYHEALVQIPMLSVVNPKHALVVGGGDGGVIRELCKWKALEKIVMVEIDESVIQSCRQYLQELSDGAFDDPRVRVHIEDAFPFVKNCTDKFDLIIMDSTDVYEKEDGSLSEQLFTEQFFGDCYNLLSQNGFIVTQADNPIFCPYSLEQIKQIMTNICANCGSYKAVIPSFGGMSAFVWGSKGPFLSQEFPDQAAAAINLRALTKESYLYCLSDRNF